MSRHAAPSPVRRRAQLVASAAMMSATLLAITYPGTASASTLPSFPIGIGPQPTPPSSYTTIQEGDPYQPAIVVVGGTGDPDSLGEYDRVKSFFPSTANIKTINSPQTVGAGFDGIFVVGTGNYTYNKSLEAGINATKQAILASNGDGRLVGVVGMSQGATIAELAVKQLAAEGKLPPGTAVVVYGDSNTLNTGLANWAPAFVPGFPTKPVDVTDMPVPTTIINNNADTWGANVSSNPVEAVVYGLPGLYVHSTAYTADEVNRLTPGSTVSQIGENTTLVVLHPKTAAGNDMNPWFYAYDLAARQYDLPKLQGPVFEALNTVLNTAVPVGESGQPTKVVGVTIPTLNALTQPLAGLNPSPLDTDPQPVASPADTPSSSPEPTVSRAAQTVQNQSPGDSHDQSSDSTTPSQAEQPSAPPVVETGNSGGEVSLPVDVSDHQLPSSDSQEPSPKGADDGDNSSGEPVAGQQEHSSEAKGTPSTGDVTGVDTHESTNPDKDLVGAGTGS